MSFSSSNSIGSRVVSQRRPLASSTVSSTGVSGGISSSSSSRLRYGGIPPRPPVRPGQFHGENSAVAGTTTTTTTAPSTERTTLASAVCEAEVRCKEKEAMIALLERKLKDQAQQAAHVERGILNALGQHRAERCDIEEKRANVEAEGRLAVEEAERNLSEAEATLREHRSAVDEEVARTEVLENKYKTLRNRVSEKKGEIEKLHAAAESERTQRIHLEERRQTVMKSIRVLEARKKEQMENLDALRSELEERTAEEATATSDLRGRLKVVAELKRTVAQLKAKAAGPKSRMHGGAGGGGTSRKRTLMEMER